MFRSDTRARVPTKGAGRATDAPLLTGPPRCQRCDADDHFRDGSGFRQRVHPLAQGTARGAPHNRGSRSRHQPAADAFN
jgi:hypothetical protein